MATLFRNGFYYVFGDVTVSGVTRYDPFENEWKTLGTHGKPGGRLAVINSAHGVIVVGDGENSNVMSRLCQINETNIDCEIMKNNELESSVWSGEVVMFTFDHTPCPESVESAALFLLSLGYDYFGHD